MAVAEPEEGVASVVIKEPPAAGPEPLGEVLAAWEALRPRAEALRAAAAERRPAWAALCAEAEATAALPAEALHREASELAVRRYGPEADRFCVMPPSIARLLPASTRSPEEFRFVEEVESAVADMQQVRQRLLEHITAAKARDDREALRDLGPRYSGAAREIRALRDLDGAVTRRMSVASRRLAAYRAGQEVRPLPQGELLELPANFAGYTKVLDFYRLSDASRYNFGRQFEGPQHFTDVKRNVAVLEALDEDGRPVFNGFAVSGVGAPGVRPDEASRGRFSAMEVEDGGGETYSRDHDAEFKLCASLCQSVPANWRGRVHLFSKKPLCRSCADVVCVQLPRALPGVSLEVTVDETEDGDAAGAAVNSAPGTRKLGLPPPPAA